MLFFSGKNMVHDVEKKKDVDGKTIFLSNFALESMRHRFTEFDGAAGKFPEKPFIAGCSTATREKDLAFSVENNSAGTNTDIIDTPSHER